MQDIQMELNRRAFLSSGRHLLGPAALALLSNGVNAAGRDQSKGLHFPAKAKNVICLFMSGGPSHVDTFDYRPSLANFAGQPLPDSITRGVHFAAISRTGRKPPVQPSPFRFSRHGKSAAWVSELMPHTAKVVDDLCFVKSMHSEVFNHDPAVSLLTTGDSRVGRPTMGAWLSYGLGSENGNLPAYIVLSSGVKVQPLLNSYWASGFLPSRHQGVLFRSSGEPVMFLKSPAATTGKIRRAEIDLINWMNQRRFQADGDPEILSRIRQYELAFRMQKEVPELVDLRSESLKTFAEYGADPVRPSFARNCVLARRMVESGVRFVHLYHMGWDSHGNLQKEHVRQCRAVDQAAAALVNDLKRRGLLDSTLVIWGGEFGRTPVAEGSARSWGRDHHPHGFTVWMAGGGIRPGVSYGSTDEFGFHAQDDKLTVHDFHATLLHCLGIDHTRLTFRHQGRDFRLTDVAGTVVQKLLA